VALTAFSKFSSMYALATRRTGAWLVWVDVFHLEQDEAAVLERLDEHVAAQRQGGILNV